MPGSTQMFSSSKKPTLSFKIGHGLAAPGGGHFSTLLNFETSFLTKIMVFLKIFFYSKLSTQKTEQYSAHIKSPSKPIKKIVIFSEFTLRQVQLLTQNKIVIFMVDNLCR